MDYNADDLRSILRNIPCMFDGVRPQREAVKDRAITISLSPQCGGYNTALRKVIIPAILPMWCGSGYK